jgi:hypothetical protein
MGKDIISFDLFGKQITLGTPHRVEMVLLFVYAVTYLWFDVIQNKVLDNGIYYMVSWVEGIKSSALDLSIIMLIIFHMVLMALFLMSLRSKGTNRFWDIIVGTLAFFGVAITLTGFVHGINSEQIRFLFIDMRTITFYHIGVGIEMFAGLYWAFTK